MMFLQYAIWGAWLPILYPFLMGHRAFDLDQVGRILAAGAVGAIIGPFVAGQVADRWLATEKFLALCHILGAVLVWNLAGVADYSTFLWMSLVYGLIYTPTLALTNSLTLHHVPDRDKDFAPIRVWGTIGWIAAGIAVGQWLLMQHSPSDLAGDALAAAQGAGRGDAFKLSAILGLIMGLYCLALPHTPPAKEGAQKNASMEALGEIKKQPLLILFLVTVPVSVIHQFYFVHTSQFLTDLQSGADPGWFTETVNTIFGVGGGGLMTVGQMAEIGVIAMVPFMTQFMSRKHMLLVGLLAYALRMAIFSYASDSMPAVVLGLALHGFCFGCFAFVAYMVVDEHTTKDVRASAQNLFNLVFVGLGIIVGSWFATSIVGSWATIDGVMDYTRLFSIPMWMSLACFAVLLVAYPKKAQVS
ncbi:MAG: MFS transporter, partial [Planctomycetota bacterium]|nr:MFS transporter [Planctomycetota bacterium]